MNNKPCSDPDPHEPHTWGDENMKVWKCPGK